MPPRDLEETNLSGTAFQMKKITWTKELAVGVERFDEQHRAIVDYINMFYDAMASHHEREVVAEILDGLINYTMTHLIEEEVELLKYGFPGYEEHRESHDKFILQVRSYHVRFHASNRFSRVLLLEILALLIEWLQGHIMVVDKKYGEYLSKRGVR